MTYLEAIVIKQLEWAISRKDFAIVSGLLNAVQHKERYESWWKQQIVAVYREKTGKGTAFSKSHEGLPELTDTI